MTDFLRLNLVAITFLFLGSLAHAGGGDTTRISKVKVDGVSCFDDGDYCYIRVDVPSVYHSSLCGNKNLFFFDGNTNGGKQLLAISMNAFNTKDDIRLVTYGLNQIEKPCHDNMTKIRRIDLMR